MQERRHERKFMGIVIPLHGSLVHSVQFLYAHIVSLVLLRPRTGAKRALGLHFSLSTLKIDCSTHSQHPVLGIYGIYAGDSKLVCKGQCVCVNYSYAFTL